MRSKNEWRFPSIPCLACCCYQDCVIILRPLHFLVALRAGHGHVVLPADGLVAFGTAGDFHGHAALTDGELCELASGYGRRKLSGIMEDKKEN